MQIELNNLPACITEKYKKHINERANLNKGLTKLLTESEMQQKKHKMSPCHYAHITVLMTIKLQSTISIVTSSLQILKSHWLKASCILSIQLLTIG